MIVFFDLKQIGTVYDILTDDDGEGSDNQIVEFEKLDVD